MEKYTYSTYFCIILHFEEILLYVFHSKALKFMITIVHFAVTIAQTYIKKTLHHFLWLSHTENNVVLCSLNFSVYISMWGMSLH